MMNDIIENFDVKEILYKRFYKYNIKKYHKYADDWVNNVLSNYKIYNIKYFIKESENYV